MYRTSGSSGSLKTVTSHLFNSTRPKVAENGSDSPVTVSTARRGNSVTITVSDRGAGIERPDLPRVFDPYFTTKRGGTGLGLPIAKNIVEGLGGTISVVSEPARGTEILIEFPVDVARDRSVA